MIEKIKKYFEQVQDNRKYENWQKGRQANLIHSTRSFIQSTMTLLPDEFDFMHLIDKYCKENNYQIDKSKWSGGKSFYVFKITKKNGLKIVAFPYSMTEHAIKCKKEKSELDGFHSIVDEDIIVNLYDIEKIDALRDYDDFVVQNTLEPIYGYKAITEENGKLKARNCEYRFNVPVFVEAMNPYQTDFQDCYVHFCKTMECVAMCPGGTNYLESLKSYSKKYPNVTRLFRVKAEGHCVQYSGDWWVTNKLTLLEEVSKEEIFLYYKSNLGAKDMVMDYLKLNENFWDDLLMSEVPLYIEKHTI